MKNDAKDVMEELNKFLHDTVVDIAVAVTEQVSKDTPRLTGFAESNWIPMIGSPISSPIGSKLAVDYSAQLAGIATISATYKLPEDIYITNSVDYILSLNNGSSTKAPSGFVQTAIAKAIKKVI